MTTIDDIPSRKLRSTTHDDNTSSERLLRTVARFVAAGYLIYFAILLPDFLRTAYVTESWWTPTAMIAVFGTGLSMGFASLAADTKWIRVTGAVATFAFLAAALSWWLAWDTSVVDTNGMPLASFPGLAGPAAAASLPSWLAFAQLTVTVVSVQLSINILRGPLLDGPLLADITFALMFCSIFVAATLGVIRTARILDSTRDTTHRQAATEAAVSARAVERERFDALIHDGVLSSLLAVARLGRTEGVIRQTEHTLAQLDSLRNHSSATTFDVDEALARLRSAATNVDEEIEIAVESRTEALYPAEVIRTASAALAEAVRNSVTHAGSDATRVATLSLTRDDISIVLSDDGSGFDPASVAPHRMGIAVSIVGRMRSLPGGSARVDSDKNDVGTTVALHWSAPS
ncbi:sensor histidine kinase [Rhodococcoides fascians]|uniref:sensor histidine kinase n=1 Tax=Rhodococcoides fascians TaxID=1828 RepID=UPI00056BFCC6|nr:MULTISPECIES: ATP-binding protein [Rhodococcus]OZF02639.1 ATP-binding protein [Rhodococcus sp. 15-1189-1-1a]OZF15814.1 ATP-binding protein [Rhodococcus sp. 14-2686-1-2]